MGAGASRTSLLVKVSANALCVSSFGVERTSAFSLLAEIGAEACVAVLSAKLSSFLDGPGLSELAADSCAGCSALSPPEGLWLIGAGSAESECELRRKFELIFSRSGSRPESVGAKVFFFCSASAALSAPSAAPRGTNWGENTSMRRRTISKALRISTARRRSSRPFRPI